MRLLDRYFLRELLIPLAYIVAGILLFWVVFDAFENLNEFQKDELAARDIGEYYVVWAPEILVEILPMTLLLALLYSLTNHARHNELTAARVAGVSLWRLMVPYLVVGVVISLGSFALNELCVPESTEAAQRILARYVVPGGTPGPGKVNSLAFWNERDRRNWAIGQYDLATAAMVNPVVSWYEGNDYSWQLLAQRAAYVHEVWTFYNVTMVKTDLHDKQALGVPVLHTNVMAMPEFSETPEQIKSEVRISSSLELPGAKKTKKADMSLTEILNYLRLHPHPSAANRSLLYTKLEGRLATPWRSVVVVLIAIPFGAVSGRRNVFMGVAGSLTICFAYFVLQQLSLAMGAGGVLAPWLAGWLPNLSFGLIGLVLTARIR